MREHRENIWNFFIANNENFHKQTKEANLNTLNEELVGLFQSDDLDKLTKFAKELELSTPLAPSKLKVLCATLARWALSLETITYPDIKDDIYNIMSTICTVVIDQFNALQNDQISLETNINFSILVYNLAILSRVCLKTPALSIRVLNDIGICINNNSQLNSRHIGNFISGLGLLAKNQCIDSTSLDAQVVNQLVTTLTHLSWFKLNSKAIAKCFYGLSLMAKAHFLNDFKLDATALQALLTILLHLPSNKWPIEISVYSLGTLVEYDYLDAQAANGLVLQVLRTINGNNNENEEEPLPDDENNEQYVKHLELSKDDSSMENDTPSL